MRRALLVVVGTWLWLGLLVELRSWWLLRRGPSNYTPIWSAVWSWWTAPLDFARGYWQGRGIRNRTLTALGTVSMDGEPMPPEIEASGWWNNGNDPQLDGGIGWAVNWCETPQLLDLATDQDHLALNPRQAAKLGRILLIWANGHADAGVEARAVLDYTSQIMLGIARGAPQPAAPGVRHGQ